MPIDRSKYPANWHEISQAVKDMAGWTCEFCGIAHGATRTNRRGKPYQVILTTAHMSSNTMDCSRENLRALCQVCHLRYDRRLHILNAKNNRRRKQQESAFRAGQRPLLEEAEIF